MDKESHTPKRLGGIELLRVIGTGGYGNVWLGLDGVNTPVAIKIIDRRVLRSEAVSREEQAMKLLRDGLGEHPNLIPLRHVGSEGDLFFYSMDLADPQDEEAKAPGEGYRPTTLQSLLAPGVPLPIDECVSICMQLLAGIEHLHTNGIIHRDLKPSNVLKVGGQWKLADFGLATQEHTELTTVGSLGYLAPNGPLGRSGDLYAIGKILYSMLTGMRVSEFPGVAEGYARSQERARFGRVLRVVNRACHHLPEKRFEAANDFIAVLANAADRSRIVMRRRANWAAAIAGVAVSAYAAGLFFGDGPSLGEGSSIEYMTIPVLVQESQFGSVTQGFDKPGGQPMTASIHKEMVWRVEDDGNGHLYRAMLVTPDADQWSLHDARAIAEEMGGYLVSLNTPEENDWVYTRLVDNEALWRDWIKPIQPLPYRSSAPEYFDESGRMLFEFSDSAGEFYDLNLRKEWGDPADISTIMLPCSRGPLVGLSWHVQRDESENEGKFVWDDGMPLEYGSWISNRPKLDYAETHAPDRDDYWDSELGPRLNRRQMQLSSFGYNAEGSNSPASTWWAQDWSNPPLSKRKNSFISFIVEIPLKDE